VTRWVFHIVAITHTARPKKAASTRWGVGSYLRAGENGPCLALVICGSAQVSSAELYREPS